MPFKNYDQIADPLTLPIGTKTYTIPPVGLADGITLADILDPASETVPTEAELNRILLGPAYEEMLADNVPGPAVIRAVLTALADHQRGRAVAEIVWENGADPKALQTGMNRAARRSTSTSTAAASTTRKVASTTGTTSPKRSNGNKSK